MRVGTLLLAFCLMVCSESRAFSKGSAVNEDSPWRRTRKRFVRLLATFENGLLCMAQSSQAKSTTFKPDSES